MEPFGSAAAAVSLHQGAGLVLLSYLFKKKNIIISGVGGVGCITIVSTMWF